MKEGWAWGTEDAHSQCEFELAQGGVGDRNLELSVH